jgi:HEAT repeat protein
MSKLALLVAIYAAGLSTWVFLQEPAAPTEESAPSTEASAGALVREGVTRARREAREETRAQLLEIDKRLERIDEMREEGEDHLRDLDTWIEETKRVTAGGLDGLKARFKTLESLGPRLRGMGEAIDDLRKEVKALADRPAVVKEVIREVASSKPDPNQPRVPTLPKKPTEDPAVVAAKITQAMKDIQAKETAVVWPGIEVVRVHKVLSAAPRLIEILGTFKDEFARQAAATALGEMQACDAVLPLAEAIADDQEVAQMAYKAITQITGFTPGLTHSARVKERRRVRNEILAWWRSNEDAVRGRLSQPKS